MTISRLNYALNNVFLMIIMSIYKHGNERKQFKFAENPNTVVPGVSSCVGSPVYQTSLGSRYVWAIIVFVYSKPS